LAKTMMSVTTAIINRIDEALNVVSTFNAEDDVVSISNKLRVIAYALHTARSGADSILCTIGGNEALDTLNNKEEAINV